MKAIAAPDIVISICCGMMTSQKYTISWMCLKQQSGGVFRTLQSENCVKSYSGKERLKPAVHTIRVIKAKYMN